MADLYEKCSLCTGEGMIHTGVNDEATSRCPSCRGHRYHKVGVTTAQLERLVMMNQELMAEQWGRADFAAGISRDSPRCGNSMDDRTRAVFEKGWDAARDQMISDHIRKNHPVYAEDLLDKNVSTSRAANSPTDSISKPVELDLE
jgi:hypothetical protein